MMKIREMIDFFENKNVSKYYYVINELGNGEVDGIAYINNKWATYYSERGEMRNIIYHESEDAAVEKLITLVNDTVMENEGRSII